jgi:hypothetical protein
MREQKRLAPKFALLVGLLLASHAATAAQETAAKLKEEMDDAVGAGRVDCFAFGQGGQRAPARKVK